MELPEKPACAFCKYFSEGFCKWRPPMILRGVTWGANNPRITEPRNEYCSEYSEK